MLKPFPILLAAPLALAACSDRTDEVRGVDHGETLLSVSASGQAESRPDRAQFQAGIETWARSAKDASSANQEKIAEIVAALRELGVGQDDIQTRAVSVRRIEWGDRKGQFQASNVVEVTMRSPDKGADAVIAVTEAGIYIVSGPSLSMTDPEATANLAYADAYKAARKRAEAYAEAAGMEVSRVLYIRDAGGTAMALKQDVADEADWDSVLDRIAQEWGSLDILVNNAGIAVLRPIENLTSADWNKQLTVNLDSVFFDTRRAVEIMRKAGKGGSIVNLSSVAGLVGVPACSAYAAAKAGVRMFGKTIAIECARDNIRVNSIHPGMIDTNMQNVARSDNAEFFDQVVDSIPMGRMGDPVDIANAVLFLSCDEGRYVTGTELVVDGGMTAQ